MKLIIINAKFNILYSQSEKLNRLKMFSKLMFSFRQFSANEIEKFSSVFYWEVNFETKGSEVPNIL